MTSLYEIHKGVFRSSLLDEIYTAIDWFEDYITVYGKTTELENKQFDKLPANFSLNGDLPNGLGYRTTKQLARTMPDIIKRIRLDLIEFAKTNGLDVGELNYCLANLYDTGMNDIAWHQDGELYGEGYDMNPIVSVSFGATRIFEWMGIKDTEGSEQAELEDGDVYIMWSGYQTTYKHRVPEQPEVLDKRISLTFRSYIQKS